mmetsp:Transcript_25378/g.64457  ORF Transcript_25378/g.64457 Transcript_25378/m.64457 type:complete len:276 (-) Transcript_25378:33-860(-)
MNPFLSKKVQPAATENEDPAAARRLLGSSGRGGGLVQHAPQRAQEPVDLLELRRRLGDLATDDVLGGDTLAVEHLHEVGAGAHLAAREGDVSHHEALGGGVHLSGVAARGAVHQLVVQGRAQLDAAVRLAGSSVDVAAQVAWHLAVPAIHHQPLGHLVHRPLAPEQHDGVQLLPAQGQAHTNTGGLQGHRRGEDGASVLTLANAGDEHTVACLDRQTHSSLVRGQQHKALALVQPGGVHDVVLVITNNLNAPHCIMRNDVLCEAHFQIPRKMLNP